MFPDGTQFGRAIGQADMLNNSLNPIRMVLDIGEDSENNFRWEIECFNDCSKGWNYYLQESLIPLVRTGNGHPNREKDHVINK